MWITRIIHADHQGEMVVNQSEKDVNECEHRGATTPQAPSIAGPTVGTRVSGLERAGRGI